MHDGIAGDGAMAAISCLQLPPTCGSAGTSSCCDSSVVPGGTFYRSYDVAGDASSGTTSFPATISGFRLDLYEVTVGRFRAFVNADMGTLPRAPAAGAGAHAHIPGSGWDPAWNASLPADTAALVASVSCNTGYQTWTNAAAANESLPINCVSWFDAFAFCAWDGGYLPTETEWNYAAAGGGDQRAYPWSVPAGTLQIDVSYANYNPSASTCINGASGMLERVGSKSPKGDGPWGHADLAGNVKEWVLDGFTTYANPCTDCAELTTIAQRTLRGGSFVDAASCARAVTRGSNDPAMNIPAFGFRCARSP